MNKNDINLNFLKQKQVNMPICTICLDECKNNLGVIECGHVFHIKCVKNWIKDKQKCPNCRKILYSTKAQELKFSIEGNIIRKDDRLH